jgi:hypothetical protein
MRPPWSQPIAAVALPATLLPGRGQLKSEPGSGDLADAAGLADIEWAGELLLATRDRDHGRCQGGSEFLLPPSPPPAATPGMRRDMVTMIRRAPVPVPPSPWQADPAYSLASMVTVMRFGDPSFA